MKNLKSNTPSVAVATSILFIGMCRTTASIAQTESVAMTLGEIVVTANHSGELSPRQVLTSVSVLPQELIEQQPVHSNYELLKQVPGVLVNDFFGKGMGHGTVSMRGFNAEGTLNAVKLLIDGVPSNANDGNTYYIDMVPRLDIEAIEVVKGTNDPRYGLHNIAGNVNLVTRQGGNYTQARATVGSFGTTGIHAAKGIENDSATQNYAFGQQKSSGFRAHSDAESSHFSGKWFVKSGTGQSRLGLIVRHMDNQAREPGYLSQGLFDENPWQVAPNSLTNRNDRQATQVAVKAESAASNQLFVSGQVYVNQLYDNRFVTFSPSPEQRRLLDEKQVGASVNATFRVGNTALGDMVLVGGFDTERQNNVNFRSDSTGTLRDHQYALNTVGGFVQAVIRPIKSLTVTPAYRVDKVDGTGVVGPTATVNATTTFPINDYGLIKQPKLSTAYALSQQLTVYGNWGKTFQIGTGRNAYQQTMGVNSIPSVNDGWEAGLKLRPTQALDGRIAIWKQTASNEAITQLGSAANATTNLGRTRRDGVDLEMNARWSNALLIWGGVSFQKAEILSTGREVDHVPNTVYSLGLDYRIHRDWRVGGSMTGQSSYFINSNRMEKAGAYTMVNASAVYQLNQITEIDFQVRNLSNHLYSYIYDNGNTATNYPVPNAPRSFHAGIHFKL